VLASQLRGRWQEIAAVSALVAVLAGPVAYTVQTVATLHTGSIVTAGPAVAGAMGGPGGRPGRFAAGVPAGVPGAQGGFPGRFPGGVPGGQGGTGAQGGMGGLLNSSTPGDALAAALETDASSYTWVAATVGSQSASGYQLATELPVMAIGGFNGSDPSATLEQFQAYVAHGRIHYFIASGMGGGVGRDSNGTSAQIAAWVESSYTARTIDGVTVYDLSATTATTTT
jgi:hypothetical protein